MVGSLKCSPSKKSTITITRALCLFHVMLMIREEKETDTEIITTACLPRCSSLYLAGAQQPSVMIKMIKHAIWFRFSFCSFLSNIVRQQDIIAMITMVFPYYNKLIILPILFLIHNDGFGRIVKISGFMCIFCSYKGCMFPG